MRFIRQDITDIPTVCKIPGVSMRQHKKINIQYLMSQKMLKIGRTPFRNTEFIYHCMREKDKYEFKTNYPPKLGEMLLSGELDIAPASSIIYAKNSCKLKILPDFSISAMGVTGSILLISNKFSSTDDLKSNENLNLNSSLKIALTSTSATSAALLKIILKIKNINAKFISMKPNIEKMLENSDASLLIGDDAIRQSEKNNYNMIDLGEEWAGLTGSGMVYALWLITNDSAREKTNEIKEFLGEIKQARKFAYENFDSVVGKLADDAGISKSTLSRHLSCLSYNLDAREKVWLQKYFKYAKDYRMIDEVPKLNFFKI